MRINHALQRFHATSPTYEDGMANHGPMAVEALETLGLAEHVDAFVADYEGRLEPLVEVAPKDVVLGDGRSAAWIAVVERDLAASSVEAVVRRMLPALLPGAMAGATHGLLRTAHALRGWEREPSAARAREVAHGLAYWAAAYQPLPGAVGTRPQVPLAEALRSLPGLTEAERSEGGFIFDRVRALDGVSRFADAIARIDLRGETLDSLLSTVTAVFARLVLTTTRAGFAYLHVITSGVATRVLARYVEPAQHVEVIRAVVHCATALHAAHGASTRWQSWSAPAVLPSLDALPTRAAATNDAHAIKLTAAVLEAYALNPDPALLVAADAEIRRHD